MTSLHSHSVPPPESQDNAKRGTEKAKQRVNRAEYRCELDEMKEVKMRLSPNIQKTSKAVRTSVKRRKGRVTGTTFTDNARVLAFFSKN
jgi:hypothetical protein